MKLFLLLLPAAAFALLAGCASRQNEKESRPEESELRVSAAVSLKDAFDELGRLHDESRAGTKIVFNYGASGVLQKQIENAAPVDVFASAGTKQMDALAERGLIVADTRRDFARNQLVLVVPHDTAFRPTSFEQLTDERIKRLAIGNPKTVPAGQYAEQLFTNLKLWQQLQSRLVLAEDVRQVLDYVARGEVEAGVVYASDIVAAGDQISVAARAAGGGHDPILYPIAVIRDSRRQTAAREFVALLLSSEGQALLHRHGFLPVSQQ
ncbi:MAG: molybdate ABC transporter substrate-binding protein [Pyrinomonadaceae bacterium]